MDFSETSNRLKYTVIPQGRDIKVSSALSVPWSLVSTSIRLHKHLRNTGPMSGQGTWETPNQATCHSVLEAGKHRDR
jgi:hypothetical protein